MHSVKLWPLSHSMRRILVEQIVKNLTTPSILSQKYGLLSKEEAEEDAKQIEYAAFVAATQHFRKEPERNGGSAAQVYARKSSELMVEFVKAGPKQKEDRETIPDLTILVDANGLSILLELLESRNLNHQRYSCVALCKLAEKASSLSPVDAGPPSPTSQVYLGKQYVNNPTFSDVTFLIEGKRFYAHRICLHASSDAFRAMFDGGYKEKDAKDIEIPNIRWDVFELMMRYIYTGSIDVNMENALDLLTAADQYLLEGLKRLCEYNIAQDILVDNVSLMYDLSEAFNAMSLKNACIIFILKNFDKLHAKSWYSRLIKRVLPEMRSYFVRTLTRLAEADKEECTVKVNFFVS
ncbi:putative chromatin remodeling & transcription regulator BTB-POZ family [Helianthus debilis subsp. tardiflorus]